MAKKVYDMEVNKTPANQRMTMTMLQLLLQKCAAVGGDEE